MARAELETRIARSADDVWALIGDFGGLEAWLPGVESCEVDGDSRTVSMMGMSVREELREHDDASRTIGYSIVDSPIPLDAHLSTISVAAADGGAAVTWLVDVTPDEMLDAFTGIYQGALDALKAKLEG